VQQALIEQDGHRIGQLAEKPRLQRLDNGASKSAVTNFNTFWTKFGNPGFGAPPSQRSMRSWIFRNGSCVTSNHRELLIKSRGGERCGKVRTRFR
jgi:hypothetical protein